ncbi:hypothetical protein GQ53DRAFT_813638 [Thozetella sp. PMI_491]|nr:hypothetical protein GQ53DRAFT_813638 [Thozetella sp. PMI_491]
MARITGMVAKRRARLGGCTPGARYLKVACPKEEVRGLLSPPETDQHILRGAQISMEGGPAETATRVIKAKTHQARQCNGEARKRHSASWCALDGDGLANKTCKACFTWPPARQLAADCSSSGGHFRASPCIFHESSQHWAAVARIGDPMVPWTVAMAVKVRPFGAHP